MILARLLTPYDFGLLTMVLTFSLLLENVGYIGVTEAIVQGEDIDHAKITSLFWLNILVSFFLCLVFMMLSPWIAGFYGEPKVTGVALWVALSIVACNLSTVHIGLLQRNMQFYETSVISIASKGISVVVAIILAWYGWGYWALVAGYLATTVLLAAGAWMICRWRPGRPAVHRGILPMIRFALHTYGNYSLNYCSRNSDNLLIGWRFGSQALGYYKKAYDLFAMPATFLTSNLAGVALSALSKIRHEPEKYRRTYLESISNIAFIGMPLSAILTLTGKDVILLILGPQWTKAGEIFMWFGLGIGVMLIYATNGWLHLSLGRADRWFRWGIVEFSVTLALFIIGLNFGPSGVAAAWTLSFFILVYPGLRYAGQPVDLKFTSILSIIWKYLVCALFAGSVSWYLLYTEGFLPGLYAGWPVIFRIVSAGMICLVFYLVLVIAVYRGVEPIARFTRVLKDMLPSSK
jgi:PST family polysaccharide transporter